MTKARPMNLTRKLFSDHLVGGEMEPGREIAIRVDQTLTQDATGTLVMLEIDAMGLDRVRTELSAQYVDHNLLQADSKNADDHLFLQSACRRFGIRYSGPGNGVSHVVHMQCFGRPGRTLLGSDSHTCAAGSLGMLAIGAGGLDVALAMAGRPCHIEMPAVWGVRLTGELPEWVSAKDVVLEMLRRHGVRGGVGRVIEYHGPGLRGLTAMDRHVIANMGAELGATSTVFPSDDATRRYLEGVGRRDEWTQLRADDSCDYDIHEEIDLSKLEPLIAKPSSPGNVVPVREIAGEEIYQAYVGSSANPGFRDFAVCAHMVKGRRVAPGVSFDVNPTSRHDLERMVSDGLLGWLIASGARLHQTGCNGCIGMGQAPATGRNSLRTTPRNFPGRSGTKEDRVFLCSPETATASALKGVITDPRDLGIPYPEVGAGRDRAVRLENIDEPPAPADAARVQLVKGPNIGSIPDFESFPDELKCPVLLKVGDDISTDEILPAGARVLPYRSNISRISEFAFEGVDPGYPEKARGVRRDGHIIVGGHNYGQGSSREHAALATRFLGLRVVVAKSFARIHAQNLVNFGVLPLTFSDEGDYDRIDAGDELIATGAHEALRRCRPVPLENPTKMRMLETRYELSERYREILLAGGVLPWMARSLRS